MSKSVNSYPEQPNAPIEVIVGITSRYRSTVERWRMTTTATESFDLYTTLNVTDSVLKDFLTPIWNYTVRERAREDIDTVIAAYKVQIDNVTAPAPPTGAWVQKKMHLDGRITDGEYDSLEALQIKIEDTIAWLKKIAKY